MKKSVRPIPSLNQQSIFDLKTPTSTFTCAAILHCDGINGSQTSISAGNILQGDPKRFLKVAHSFLEKHPSVFTAEQEERIQDKHGKEKN